MKITMTIEVATPEELAKILSAIGAGTVVTNNVTATKAKDRVAEVQASEQQDAAAEAPKPEKGSQEAKDKMAAVRAARDAKKQQAEAEPEPAKTTTATKAKPVDEGAITSSIELPDNIKGTSSMRDLLMELFNNHGIKTEDAMVKACVGLKSVVPILTKVPNVEDRVRKAVAVLDLFPAKAAQAEASE